MADDFQKGSLKTIDITVQTAKMTEDVLKQALQEFLNGSSDKKGKMSLQQLENKSNGKLESIEITDNNIRDFLEVARKYNVDYALKRDKTSEPATYHVFFQSDKTENFKRAFDEYSSNKNQQIEKQKTPYNRQKMKEQAQEIANQPRERKEKVRERSKENAL